MSSKTKVFLAYDERMTLHRPKVLTEDTASPDFVHERPSRLLAVYEALMKLEERLVAEQIQDESHIQSILQGVETFEHEAQCMQELPEHEHKPCCCEVHEQHSHLVSAASLGRFIPLECIPASRETICHVHSEEHYEFMKRLSTLSDKALDELTNDLEDLYFCRDTFGAALLAVGGCVGAVNAVTAPFCATRRAMALVRPPAHHATRDAAMGESNIDIRFKLETCKSLTKKAFFSLTRITISRVTLYNVRLLLL